MRDLLYNADTEAATAALAVRMAADLGPGDVLALYGDLGAGKTYFSGALKEALGAVGPVQSPTFTMLRVYDAGPDGLAFNHFDAYRLTGTDDWYALGFDEHLDGEAVSAIEWADRIEDALPDRTIRLHFEKTGEAGRTIHVCWPSTNDANTGL